MAHDIFICHSAKDKTTADAVCAALEANGVRCWIAPRDVIPGMEWSECIIDAIEECRIMVLIFTTHANDSPQIRREIERAVNRGVAILPLRIEDILPGRALEYFIGNVHWLDALTPPLETHLKNLAETVKMLLARMPRRNEPIPLAKPIEPPFVAAPKSEWAEPARAETREAIAPELFPERAPSVQDRQQPVAPRENYVAPPVSVPPQQNPGAAVSDAGKRKRPIGIYILVVLGVLTSGGSVIGVTADLMGGHAQSNESWFLVMAALDFAACWGLITLKQWGRGLKILHSAIAVLVLVGIVDRPFKEGSASLAIWMVLVAYFVGVMLYMFSMRAKQAFAKSV
jgi:hypothetical protein